MPDKKPYYLQIVFLFCSMLAYLLASFHFALMNTGVLKTPAYVSTSKAGKFKTIYTIWSARLIRRILSVLVRTPLRKGILKMVNFRLTVPVDSGSVLVTCHSPWKRLLVQWCLENEFALIIGGGKWRDREKLIQRKGAGYTELRNIVKHLQQKGRIILAGDFFNDQEDHPVHFLGKNCNASDVPVQIALMANVPLLVVIPKLNNQTIDFITGPQLTHEDLKSDLQKAMQQIISFMEKEIENDPSLWSGYVQ